MKAVGYIRISKDANGNGHSLDAQRKAIEQACESREWELLRIEQDIQSGGSTRNRPGLDKALRLLDSGEADYLVVGKLDRLSRSVSDFNQLLETYPRKLVILDLGVDLTSPYGEMVATVVSAMARLERRLVSERTKAALAQARASGVKLGRESIIIPELAARIRNMKTSGLSLRAIARQLNDEGVPPPLGREWRHTSLRAVLR